MWDERVPNLTFTLLYAWAKHFSSFYSQSATIQATISATVIRLFNQNHKANRNIWEKKPQNFTSLRASGKEETSCAYLKVFTFRACSNKSNPDRCLREDLRITRQYRDNTSHTWFHGVQLNWTSHRNKQWITKPHIAIILRKDGRKKQMQGRTITHTCTQTCT